MHPWRQQVEKDFSRIDEWLETDSVFARRVAQDPLELLRDSEFMDWFERLNFKEASVRTIRACIPPPGLALTQHAVHTEEGSFECL